MFAIRRLRAFKVEKIFEIIGFKSIRPLNQTMESKPILYGDLVSPPVRFTLMTAKALNIDVEFRKVDLFLRENKTKTYNEINPLEKVPALKIGDQVIRDSHAIAIYFCDKAGKQELYPIDVVERAKVNDLLFFNASTLFPVDCKIMCDYFAGVWPAEKSDIEKWNILLDYVDDMLEKSEWLAGNKVTLADICCAATITSMNQLVLPADRHTFVKKWLYKFLDLPYFSVNIEGITILQERIEAMKPPKNY